MATAHPRSAISVICRLKPTDTSALSSGDISINEKDAVIEVRNRRRSDYSAGSVDNTAEFHKFTVNGIVNRASQQEVFDSCCKDIVDTALSGISSALMAYGQTGAGKTYTMVGPAGNYVERGLVPRSINYIFEAAEKARMDTGEEKYTIRVSYLEIYQDKLIDLLASTPDITVDTTIQINDTARPSASSLHITEDSKGRVHVKGLSAPQVRSAAEAFNWFFVGEANRAVAEHALNKASTRSHCIFTVHIEQQIHLDGKQAKQPVATPKSASSNEAIEETAKPAAKATVISKLHLVDLAGSERLEKSESEGTMRKEAQAINKSLTFLEQVVLAITEKDRDHIPYRSSKLTHFLKDSFTHGKTRMIAALWPGVDYLDETIATLRFAMRMMHIKTVAQRDVITGSMSDAERFKLVSMYEKEIGVLRAELAFRDAIAGKSASTYAPHSSDEEAKIFQQAKDFVYTDNEDPIIEFSSVREAHCIMRALRKMVKDALTASGPRLPAQAENVASVVQQSIDSSAQMAATMISDTITSYLVAESARKEEAPPLTKTVLPAVDDDEARSSELQRWRSEGGPGKLLYSDYSEAKVTVKSKKAKYAELAAELNGIKKIIDDVIIEARKAEAEGSDGSKLIETLQAEKAKYRKQFDEMNDLKAEIEYVQNVADQLAQRIAKEFQRHWIAVCAGDSSAVSSLPGSQLQVANEDGVGQAVSPDGIHTDPLQLVFEGALMNSAKLKAAAAAKSPTKAPFSVSPRAR